MDSPSTSRKQEIIAGLAVLLVVVAIVAATTLNARQKSSAQTITTAPTEAASTNGYKDGSYSAAGGYETPGGSESMKVRVTLQGGVVTAVSASAKTDNQESVDYADSFLSSYKSSVVGKNINSLSLSRVAGASLTTMGFNNALKQIKQAAYQG
jgi:uncharacterized protein with FMN-binding domain